MMTKYPVKVKEVESARFFFIEVGRKDFFRPHKIVWIQPKLIKKEKEQDVVEFPIRAKVVTTDKGTIKLTHDESYTTYDVLVPCGYRGESQFEFLQPVETVVSYVVFHSERGSLGVSKGALVTVKGSAPLKVKYQRSGRLYGAPATGIRVFYPDGRVEDLEIADLSELSDVTA